MTRAKRLFAGTAVAAGLLFSSVGVAQAQDEHAPHDGNRGDVCDRLDLITPRVERRIERLTTVAARLDARADVIEDRRPDRASRLRDVADRFEARAEKLEARLIAVTASCETPDPT